jgi:hypothetical protein
MMDIGEAVCAFGAAFCEFLIQESPRLEHRPIRIGYAFRPRIFSRQRFLQDYDF